MFSLGTAGLYELWTSLRLVLEKAVPGTCVQGVQFSVSAVPVGPGIDIWRSCGFMGVHDAFLQEPLWWSAWVRSLLH